MCVSTQRGNAVAKTIGTVATGWATTVASARTLPMKLGWNKTFERRERATPTVMMLPSGSS